MLREVLKQMFPFIVLLAVLWAVAELLDRTIVTHTIIAPPIERPASP